MSCTMDLSSPVGIRDWLRRKFGKVWKEGNWDSSLTRGAKCSYRTWQRGGEHLLVLRFPLLQSQRMARGRKFERQLRSSTASTPGNLFNRRRTSNLSGLRIVNFVCGDVGGVVDFSHPSFPGR